MKRSTLWLAALLALPAAYWVRDPLFMQVRGVVTLLLWLVAGAALLVLIKPSKKKATQPRGPGLLIALWLVVLLWVSIQELRFRWDQQQTLNQPHASASALGAHFIVGYTDREAIAQLARQGLIGGIYVSNHHMQGTSVQAIQAEIAVLQDMRKSAGLAPLIVSTDQEGGIVSHMSPPLTPMPSLAQLIAQSTWQEIEGLSFAYGQQHGRELASLGINVNFAPVADLSTPDKHQRLDFRSLINQRAIGSDPHRVSIAITGYALGLESEGVRATLKHFPGLGRVRADTHLFRAALNTPTDELMEHDWIPFRHGLKSTQSLLMVGHATLSAVDPHTPASLSKKVVQGVVRDEWGHDGVIVTDDLSMGPVMRHGICRAGVDAINAGVDLLLVSYDTDQYYTVMQCLLRANQDGLLDAKQLAKSAARLNKLTATLH